ncbi:MAG: cytochrome c biogenesis protein CcsA [Odoribacteraceae bacterium]|jgi:ABC-type transport system involved in cytochrome c biogenesis permease subunit|nr:cytochrome c biogenesis protein CcsA [Odoribacteraceae bacterium]
MTTRKIAFGTLIALLPVLAAATLLERFAGREAAERWIYAAPWFVAAWAILALSALAYILRVALYRRPVAFIFHLALLLILAGALVTFLAAERGSLHLRQGETLHHYLPDDDGPPRPLPFRARLLLFDVEYDPDTGLPADYHTFLQIDGETRHLSMNNPLSSRGYRLYQHDYDPDEMGVALLVTRDAAGSLVTHLAYLLLLLSTLLLLPRRVSRRLLLLLAALLAVAWLCIAFMPVSAPVLRSPFLAAHVSLIIVSYLLLLVIAVLSLVALLVPRLLIILRHRVTALLYPAVFLLSAGIFTGAAWADLSWGRYWGWDAKETWALVALLLYALPLHHRHLSFFRSPRRFHLFCLFALLAVLVTSLGVAYFLGGLHAYL